MAEFCSCGSLLIDNHCTNKHCSHSAATKTATSRKSAAKTRIAGTNLNASKTSVKASNPRRASKVITYNLYDTQVEEPEN